MRRLIENLFGIKVNKTRVKPLTVKILILFTIFILVSNFATNYINLTFNRAEMVNKLKDSLIKDLKNVYNYSNSQFEIYSFNNDLEGAMNNIRSRAIMDFNLDRSVVLLVNENSEFLNQVYRHDKEMYFADNEALNLMIKNRESGKLEDFIEFKYSGAKYFGVYKYNSNWNTYIIRAEEINEFYKRSNWIFFLVSLIIILMTLVATIIGAFFISFILRFIHIITRQIMEMLDKQQLGVIELKGATNDDVTFLGVAFNSLSSTINNLMNIFLKFVNKDIAAKAYKERTIKLEGSRKELTILFSDIRGFTYMTETLGIDIIKLLNMHYESAIHYIMMHDGIIGSIIGDALLAVYGALDDNEQNKSFQAVTSAYEIQKVTEALRSSMKQIRAEIEIEHGNLTESEEKVFKAVLIEVGVGIDGGEVFYGTIGSSTKMTNTVIGDNVNSSSRLEGLTRIYNIPVICSEYVMNDIINNVKNHGLIFIEIDTVQVKGKTIGKKIYLPVFDRDIDDNFRKGIADFSEGLDLYYKGKWTESIRYFEQSNLPMAQVFLDRTKSYNKPEGWDGIWTMTTK